MFISFEGGEGSGKTTQIATLAARLQNVGLSVETFREPGGSPGAEAIRDLVLNGPVELWNPMEELLLFSAARHELLRRQIRPALANGHIVLCDRFADSSAVYQGVAGGLSAATIASAEAMATDGQQPDLTLLLDLPVAVGLARAGRRIEAMNQGLSDGRFEEKSADFHAQVRAGFLQRAAQEPERIHTLNADQSAEALSEEIWAIVGAKVGPR